MLKKISITTLTLLALASTSGAATLYSAPIKVGSTPGHYTACSAVNVSPRETDVTIHLYQFQSGSPYRELRKTVTRTVAPSHYTSASLTPTGGLALYQCEFIVQGGKNKVRANACVADQSGGVGSCISSVPVH